MNLREEILAAHSRPHSLKIVNWIGTDTARLAALMDVFLTDEYRLVQRSAHLLGLIAGKQPELLSAHIPALVKRLQQEQQPVAVKRNVVRILQFIAIPEDLHGEVMTVCFDLLADVKETIAVRACSMTVLANLSRQYPDIRQELKTIIEDGLEQQPSPGFRSRAKKVLAVL